MVSECFASRLLLGGNALRFIRNGFYISARVCSFPLAAITIASFVIGLRSGNPFFDTVALALLGLLSLIASVLVVKTLGAVRKGAICIPE